MLPGSREKKDGFLSLNFELTEFGVMDAKERLRRYRRYVYETGVVSPPDKSAAGGIDEKILENERANEFNVDRIRRVQYRTRYFTTGMGTRIG